MIRLFVAIDLPEELRLRAAALCTGVDGARWVAEENLHITLRFIGEVPNDTANDIVGALERVRSEPFSITLAGAGHFESGRRVRALWLGVEGEEEICALHDRVESALVRNGLPPEGRKFKPHLTLARLKDGRSAAVAGWLQANAMFRAFPFTVDKFVLFSSHLGRNGAIYTPIAEFPLGLFSTGN